MKVAKILFINLILLAIIFIIFEIYLRNFNKVKTLQITEKNLYKFNKDLGWTFNPNISEFFSNPHGIGVRVNTNKDGFRDKEILRNHNKKKILFLGDSMTAAIQVEEHERFSELLGNKLDFESYNLAINGYSTDQAIIVLKKYIEKINPDIILYYMVNNDLYLNDQKYLRSGFGNKWSKPILDENFEIIHAQDSMSKKKKIDIKNYLKDRFATVRFMSLIKNSIFKKNKQLVDMVSEKNKQSVDLSLFEHFYFDDEKKIKEFEVFKKLMKEMKKISDKYNSILIVSRSITIIDVDLEIQKIGQEHSKNIYNIDNIYSDYENKIKNFFSESEIAYLPIDKYNLDKNDIKNKIFFYDKNNNLIDGHYTKFGHEYVAETMYKFVKNYIE